MHKKTILSSVMAVLLALSMSYFALLAPTTAWFFQEESDAYSFTFGNFDFSQTAETVIETDIKLNGATRFADKGEILFDEAAHVVKIEAQNNGELPAALSVAVENQEGCANTGLKYCIIRSATQLTNPVAPTASISKGEYKSEIESIIEESMTLHDYSDFTDADTYVGRESLYDEYNSEPVSLLNAHNAAPLIFDAFGSLEYVYIVFWVEYSDVDDILLGNTTTTLDSYGVTITLTANPEIPETAALEINNTTGSNISLNVAVDRLAFVGNYTVGDTTYTATSGNMSIAAGATATIILPVGTEYALSGSAGVTITSSSGTIGNLGVVATVATA